MGDSAHAMQPNLGQGGCMAIEDGYQLASDLSEAVAKAGDGECDLEGVLKVSSLRPSPRILHSFCRIQART